MARLDGDQERKTLRKSYAGMSDEELQAIACDRGPLAEIAKEELLAEMNSRGIQIIASGSRPSRAASSREDPATDKSAPVLIAQYLSLPEATLAKSMLESAGIESFLADENLVRIDWLISNILGGVKLFVLPENVEAAESILEQAPPEKFEVEGVGEFIQPRCPSCQSKDVSFEGPEKPQSYVKRFIEASTSVIQGDPQYWECRACGRRWKDEDPELPPVS